MTAGQLSRFHRESVIHNLLGFKKDRVQVRPVLETFRVNLVDALRAGRARGEPAAIGGHLQAADRRVVARSVGQLARDRLAREL